MKYLAGLFAVYFTFFAVGAHAEEVAKEGEGNQCPVACSTCTPPAPELPVWRTQVALGYSITGGNTVTESFTPELHVVRQKDGAQSIFGAMVTYGEYQKKETQNTGRAALIHREDFADVEKFGDGRFYWGVGVTGMYDKQAHIDHRVPVFAGVGVHLIKTEIFETDFEIAPGYQFDHHGGISDEHGIYRIGNFTSLALSKSAMITVDTDFTESLENSGDWVVNVTPSIGVMMNPVLGIKIGSWYRHENLAIAGRKKEDWTFGSAITLNF